MDNVTHTLFALTLARPRLGRAGRGTTTALVLASNAPDIDIVTTAGGVANYLHWHRRPTHGLPGILHARCRHGRTRLERPALLRRPACAHTSDERRHRAGTTHVANASFRALVLVSIVGVLLHVLMDLPNGTARAF